MNWCRIDKEKRCAEIFYLNPYTKKKLYNQYNYYSVSPGVYYLDRIREKNPSFFTDFVLAASLIAPKPKPNFTTSGSGFNKKTNSTNFASFEIKSGEIVYIGDLHFTITKQKYWVKGKIELEVEDNYDMAVNPFREKSPEFKNKSVIKRLARPGTLLNNFDAGIFW